MHLFTFIMEFRGGTYISQVKAQDIRAAMTLWGQKLEFEEIKYLGKKGILAMQDELKDEEPMPLDGVESVWCFCLSVKTGFMLINVVKTAVD